MAGVGLFPLLIAFQALRTGWIARRSGLPFRRSTQPREYWTYVLLTAAMGGALVAASAW